MGRLEESGSYHGDERRLEGRGELLGDEKRPQGRGGELIYEIYKEMKAGKTADVRNERKNGRRKMINEVI